MNLLYVDLSSAKSPSSAPEKKPGMPRLPLPHFLQFLPVTLALVALPAFATPPAAPSDLRVFMTKTSASAHTYVFFFSDGSSDEDGFQIRSRFGTSGPFEL